MCKEGGGDGGSGLMETLRDKTWGAGENGEGIVTLAIFCVVATS